MKESILDYLVNQYGQRIDIQQPIIARDNVTIRKQLEIVEKQLNQTKIFGLLWTIIGSATLAINAAALATETDAAGILQLGISTVFLIYGIWNFNRRGYLKGKKVILETILFINKD